MLKLGIIGTNWITEQFVDAAHDSEKYQLVSIYSRSKAKGLTFGEKYQVTTVYDDLTAFMTATEMDVVYIASPNSLHFEQSLQALQAGKHVIVEKPAVTSTQEWQTLVKTAEEQGRFIFEAARNIHEKNFKTVTDMLPASEEIIGANLNFMKYSSRYDLVLNGEEPNIFSPKFAGGALMDLGVYVMYAAVAWFGKPTSAHYFARKIATGVDGLGTIILRYPQFDVTMQTGKIANSYLPSEIYTTTGTILLDAVNSIETIQTHDLGTNEMKDIVNQRQENPMVEEALAFAEIMENPTDEAGLASYQSWLAIGGVVHELMADFRREIDMPFGKETF